MILILSTIILIFEAVILIFFTMILIFDLDQKVCDLLQLWAFNQACECFWIKQSVASLAEGTFLVPINKSSI